ncbi:MAG: GTP-binding protein [Crenarchaeota archaeon]|nr:GTP-binding protein [Thermoproteota archaeon]MCR8454792.1 GTP-binding protein [Thermoproteota archaeon]MCR8501128.1 GTP-binding protein [Thermoproteota archaeon]
MKKFPPSEQVRNVAIAGHIDHGKTTMADYILAEVGVIAKSLAGKARFLDYWLEEQRRGITMKTTVMSLRITRNSSEYLVHLVDTPGHVDFSGKVSRALRLADSAIFVVDAVEGVMAQTESYLRLALREVVRPILFINKIDRLINEIKASPAQIYSKLSSIIKRFNSILERYAFPELASTWQINPKDDTIIFGSALHGWGLVYSDFRRYGLKFEDIIDYYRSGKIQELQGEFPLGKKIINVILDKCPPPVYAQKIRVKYLWNGELPENALLCSPDSEVIFYVSKVSIERGLSYITARVFSGTVKPGEYINSSKGERRRLQSVFLIHANKLESIAEVPAGNIFGGVMNALPGETYSEKPIDGYFVAPMYTAYPVLVVAISPKNYGEIKRLLEALERLVIEDPNLSFRVSEETGQIILHGLGELHLELAIKNLNETVPVFTTEPIVAFKEIPKEKVKISTDALEIIIEPIEDVTSVDAIKNLENRVEITGVLPPDKKSALESIILNSLRAGPRIREPIVATRISVKIKEKIPESEIIQKVYEALSSLQTYVAQPYYSFSIITDHEFIGQVTSLLSSRNAKIENVTSTDLCEISGRISVLDSLGFAEALRNATHGRASVQLEYWGFRIANENEEKRIFEYLSRISHLPTGTL